MLTIVKENVLINVEANSSEEVIRLLAELLAKNGYIKSEYADVVLAREKEYPTGLPTGSIRVAIPHGFADDCVLSPTVGAATLAHPVVFRNMFDSDMELGVEMVFLIALSSQEKYEQAKNLEKVMNILPDGDLLNSLYISKSGEEFVEKMGNRLTDDET
jgi:PTS system galactitol-specific IIA component